MPFPSNASLPKGVKVLPPAAQTVWRKVVNDRLAAGKSEESSIKQAWSAVKNGWKKVGDRWVKKLTDKFALDTRELKDVEIFAVGKWNGHKYTEKDLFDIANNFNRLKDTVKPYLKLGHDDDQKLLQSDGYPAAGWIVNLKVVGEKLVADFAGIPGKIFDLIEAGGYKRVSSELYINFRDSLGNVYNKVLRAVALLGADTPAVGVLGDLVAQYDEDQESEAYSFKTEGGEIVGTKNKINKEDEKMTVEEIKKLEEEKAAKEAKAVEDKKVADEKVASDAKAVEDKKVADGKVASDAKAAEEKKAADAKADGEKTAGEETKKLTDEVAKLTEELATEKKAKKEANTKAFTDKLLSEQKIDPKQTSYVATILNSLDETEIVIYKEGKEEKKMSIVDTFKRLMDANTERQLLGEISVGDKLTFTDLEGATEAEMKADKTLKYADALKIASKKFPSLVEEPKEL